MSLNRCRISPSGISPKLHKCGIVWRRRILTLKPLRGGITAVSDRFSRRYFLGSMMKTTSKRTSTLQRRGARLNLHTHTTKSGQSVTRDGCGGVLSGDSARVSIQSMCRWAAAPQGSRYASPVYQRELRTPCQTRDQPSVSLRWCDVQILAMHTDTPRSCMAVGWC